MATTGDHFKQSSLLVDDEHRPRGIPARFLRARGHVITEAFPAPEARAALLAGSVDVLLLDVNLPDITGWNLPRRLAGSGDAHRQRPHVVMLSALPPASSRITRFHPDTMLIPPIPIDALACLVGSDCRADPHPVRPG